MTTGSNRERFIVFDYVGFGFSCASLLWAIVAIAIFAPAFGAMFDEFGGTLPRLTALFLTRWFPIALGLVPSAVVALGAFAGARRGLRGLAMSAAILITLAQPILFFAAMYLPIVALADGIQ
jgi:type II secretory pathway component PulF